LNILILTKYPTRGPSSRYRFYQFLPHLSERGHRFTVLPFFTDAYLASLFDDGRVGPLYVFQRLLARLGHCLRGKPYDLVWIEGELLPFIPSSMERLFHLALPRRRVYEFDDANWLRYEGKPLLEKKFLRILSSAAGVVVGNDFLADYVRQVNASIAVVPTVVDWARYEPAVHKPNGLTIGWIGSQKTSFFLEDIFPALRELATQYPLKLKVVGARIQADGFPLEEVVWSEDTEVSHIESFDIGVMPLTATPWSRGKCGLKLIQYLAAGIPAVASSVGVNTGYLNDSGGGFLAEDHEDWVHQLRKLLDNETLRKDMGRSGREWVRSEMTITAQAPKLINFLEQCARKG